MSQGDPFDQVGIHVDARGLTAANAEEFKSQVQNAWLLRNHEVRSFFSITRIELRDHANGVSAHVFGGAGYEIGSYVGATPRDLADEVYASMGGEHFPPRIEVCEQTIAVSQEREDIRKGIAQAFRARPQKGKWAVSVKGESGRHSDLYAFTFRREGLEPATVTSSVAELHIGIDGFIAQVTRLVDTWFTQSSAAV